MGDVRKETAIDILNIEKMRAKIKDGAARR